MALLLPNTRIYLTGDSDPLSPIGVSVLVCNHVMEGDWWAILMLARCVGLRGSVKPFLQSNHVVPSTTTTTTTTTAVTTATATTNTTTVMVDSSDNNNSSNSNSPIRAVMDSNNNHNNNNLPSNNGNGNGTTTTTPSTATTTTSNMDGSSLILRFLHTLLEFPMLSSEHTQNYITDREELFSLLRSFASNGAPAPTHLLLFPEGWRSGVGVGHDRKSMMTKSIEFAKREGRPQLQHLLLPRTTGFYASLDSLREASPVIYDVTMAYRGYDGGEKEYSCDINLGTIMKLIRGEIPNEVHIRIKRYSMEEVLSDGQWLDKQWAEKDRLLGKFVRCGNFNVDNRGFCRYRVLDSKLHSVESSITAIIRLGLIPFAIPVIFILFIPLVWGVAWVWVAQRTFLMFFPGGISELIGITNMGDGYRYGRGAKTNKENSSGTQDDISNGGTDSVAGTPFFPATPFASPTHVTNWMPSAPSTSKDSD